ncbi:BEM_collapsed_G0016560.mRNA.1.CDS.1 [Saccharomyces cerevisiae]|nr:BEM_collapsed_G0016560.mRNA.1.CDS.1 [Saccharomyces cerevisiae]
MVGVTKIFSKKEKETNNSKDPDPTTTDSTDTSPQAKNDAEILSETKKQYSKILESYPELQKGKNRKIRTSKKSCLKADSLRKKNRTSKSRTIPPRSKRITLIRILKNCFENTCSPPFQNKDATVGPFLFLWPNTHELLII